MMATAQSLVRFPESASNQFSSAPSASGCFLWVADVEKQRGQPFFGGQVIFQTLHEGVVSQSVGQALAQRFTRSMVVRQPEVATNYVLQQAHLREILSGPVAHGAGRAAAGSRGSTHRWSFYECRNHVAQDIAHSVESLSSRADVIQTHLIQQDFLHDERRHGFRQLQPRLHDA